MSISPGSGQKPATVASAGGAALPSTQPASVAPHAGSHDARAVSAAARAARFLASRSLNCGMCGAALAVGVSSSQSLLLQVGTGYRDQGHDRASSRGDAYWPWG